MTPFEHKEAWEKWIVDAGNRLAPHPAFEILPGGFDFDRHFEIMESSDQGLVDTDLSELLDAPLISDVHAALPDGARVRVVDADSGRGASGFALALEILDLMATVGGAAAFAVGSAKAIKRIYEVIAHRTGKRPVVSVGAAKYLAAADLIDRLDTEDFELIGSGEIRDQTPDFSYTGEDHFYVIFERARETFFYLVESDGKVRYVGNVERNPTPIEQLMEEGDEP